MSYVILPCEDYILFAYWGFIYFSSYGDIIFHELHKLLLGPVFLKPSPFLSNIFLNNFSTKKE